MKNVDYRLLSLEIPKKLQYRYSLIQKNPSLLFVERKTTDFKNF
jgi:hypothetical protein